MCPPKRGVGDDGDCAERTSRPPLSDEVNLIKIRLIASFCCCSFVYCIFSFVLSWALSCAQSAKKDSKIVSYSRVAKKKKNSCLSFFE